jgi:hypothetical protein
MSTPIGKRSTVKRPVIKKKSDIIVPSVKSITTSSIEDNLENANDPIKKINNDIANLLENNCSHTTYQYNYSGIKIPETCSSICEKIMQLELKNSVNLISEDNVMNFYNYILNVSNKNAYYTQYRCLSKNVGVFIKILPILFKHFSPPEKLLFEMINERRFDICFKSLLLNGKFDKFNSNFISTVVNERFNSGHKVTNDSELIDVLIKNIDMTSENLYILCDNRDEELSFILSSIIDKFDGDVDENFLDISCKGLPFTKTIINSLLSRGLVLSDKHLKIACSECPYEGIEYVLNVGRVPVQKEHFTALIKSKDTLSYITNPNVVYNVSRSKISKQGYTIEKMNLLFAYGYKPDYNDIKISIINKKEIPNIERFDIVLDKELLELCWDNDYYPPYNFNCIEQSMIKLQMLCNTKKLSEIKSLIKLNNIVPDRKCMENASAFKRNKQIMDVLLANGGKITLKCIKNASTACDGPDSFILSLVNEYEKSLTEEINVYKDRIAQLESHIKNLEGNVTTMHKTIDLNSNINNDTDNINKIENNNLTNLTVNKVESTNHPVKKVAKKPPVKKSSKVTDSIKTKAKSKKIVIIDDETQTDESQTEENTTLNIDIEKVINIQKKHRLKSLPTQKIVQVFKVDKTTKLSYSDVKKLFIEKIRDNDWMDKTNKDVINLPDKIKVELGINKGCMVKFDDIDKIICLFYE